LHNQFFVQPLDSIPVLKKIMTHLRFKLPIKDRKRRCVLMQTTAILLWNRFACKKNRRWPTAD